MTDEQLVAAIRESAANVFSTMLNLQVSPGAHSQQTEPAPVNGVVALLGLTGHWVGTGMLYCHEKLACYLSSIMLASPVSDVTNDVLDGVGELANMVMGNVKDRLEPLVGALDMSVPTVVYGRNFQTRSKVHRDWLIAPFQVDGQTFEIRVCLEAKP